MPDDGALPRTSCKQPPGLDDSPPLPLLDNVSSESTHWPSPPPSNIQKPPEKIKTTKRKKQQTVIAPVFSILKSKSAALVKELDNPNKRQRLRVVSN